MAERVPEVQRDPAGGCLALAFIGHDHRDLRPGAALDDLGHDPGVEDIGGRRAAIAGAVGLEELEQALVAEDRHLDRLPERRSALALRQVRRVATSTTTAAG